MSRRTCDTKGCGQPRADDCRFCPDCRDDILRSIADRYEGLDLEHHEMPRIRYEELSPLYVYARTKEDKQE